MLVSKVLNDSLSFCLFFFLTTKGGNRGAHGHTYEQHQIYDEQYFRNGPKALHSLEKTVAIVSSQDALMNKICSLSSHCVQ